jgi:hypothetical protein
MATLSVGRARSALDGRWGVVCELLEAEDFLRLAFSAFLVRSALEGRSSFAGPLQLMKDLQVV